MAINDFAISINNKIYINLTEKVMWPKYTDETNFFIS